MKSYKAERAVGNATRLLQQARKSIIEAGGAIENESPGSYVDSEQWREYTWLFNATNALIKRTSNFRRAVAPIRRRASRR